MADQQPDNTDASGEDAKVRAEWQRLERRRIDDEIAEAREDATGDGPVGSHLPWWAWVAFAVALAAGIAVTAAINGLFSSTP